MKEKPELLYNYDKKYTILWRSQNICLREQTASNSKR